MSAGFKKSQNSLKKGDVDTTLSGKLHATNTIAKQPKQTVSPFQLENYGQANQSLGLSTNQLNAVKDINYQYVQLYQHLFKENKQLARHQYAAKDQSSSAGIITKEQKYQLQCIKLVTNASQNIEKLRIMRQIRHEWAKVASYAHQFSSQKDQSFSIQKCKQQSVVQLANHLIQRYQQISHKIKQAEEQYKALAQPNLQPKQQNKIINLQKQLKANKQKLNDAIKQEQDCLAKCSEQQNILQQLQKQIKKSQKEKLNIQMKIIGQQGKRDKMMRKIKRQKEKSVNNLIKKQHQQKNTTSKSLTKWKLPRYEI